MFFFSYLQNLVHEIYESYRVRDRLKVHLGGLRPIG